MKKTVTTCDICGSELSGYDIDRVHGVNAMILFCDNTIEPSLMPIDDICSECNSKIMNVINIIRMGVK